MDDCGPSLGPHDLNTINVQPAVNFDGVVAKKLTQKVDLVIWMAVVIDIRVVSDEGAIVEDADKRRKSDNKKKKKKKDQGMPLVFEDYHEMQKEEEVEPTNHPREDELQALKCEVSELRNRLDNSSVNKEIQKLKD